MPFVNKWGWAEAKGRRGVESTLMVRKESDSFVSLDILGLQLHYLLSKIRHLKASLGVLMGTLRS